MVLKNKLKNRRKILEDKESSIDSKKSNSNNLKRKIKGIASIALIMAQLGIPVESKASDIYPVALEIYQTMERLERYGDLDTLQEYLKFGYTYEERNFVNLLEDGAIFVLNTRQDDKELIITRVDEVIMPGTEAEITEKNDGATRIVYGKLKGFAENNIEIPSGYQKCICLDHIQDIDETVVGDFDYVQISPKYNTNTAETKDFYTKQDYDRIMGVVHELTQNIKEDDNDFVKMAKIYLALIEHLNYDYESLEAKYDRDHKCGNLLSLCDGLGVCAGYADAACNLGRYVGVECNVAWGGMEDKEGHAWDVFYYTDKYGQKRSYGFDATWGDSDKRNASQYFATNNFELSHYERYNTYSDAIKTDFGPIIETDLVPKSNDGFENDFIEGFLTLVANDINIRPETLSEMQQRRYNC